MTYATLMEIVDGCYPDGCTSGYHNSRGPRRNRDGGDTLAEFAAFELYDTFDRGLDEDEQIAIENAIEDLQKVIDGLIQANLSEKSPQ